MSVPAGGLLLSNVNSAYSGNTVTGGQYIGNNTSNYGANGGTIGLAFDSPEKVDAWHAAGIANGGTSCEEAPGVRDMGDFGKLYLAYLRDPDGNKLCALHGMG